MINTFNKIISGYSFTGKDYTIGGINKKQLDIPSAMILLYIFQDFQNKLKEIEQLLHKYKTSSDYEKIIK